LSVAAYAIAVGGRSIWTANFAQKPCRVYEYECAGGTGSVFRIDPGSNLVEQKIHRGQIGRPVDAAYGDESVWVVNDRSLLRVDPAANRVVAKIKLPYRPVGVATGDGRVWVAVGAAK
jgi:DNA-binding beta-propeller fold protein YncE